MEIPAKSIQNIKKRTYIFGRFDILLKNLDFMTKMLSKHFPYKYDIFIKTENVL